MTHHRPAIPAVLLALLCFPLVAAGEVPSIAKMRQLAEEKQYKRVLREVARAMQLKGDDAAPYDRGELLLIRADAQLGLRIEPAAAKSYRDAGAAATRAGDRATARATGLLLSRCEQLLYKPRTGEPPGQEIDIVAERQAAFDALLADELAVVGPKVRAAQESKTIAEVLDAAATVETVGFVELAATGSTTRTDEFFNALAARVETLLDDVLIELNRKADDIETHALGLIAVPQEIHQGQAPPTTLKAKKRGLSPGDEAALKRVMETCREVVSHNRGAAAQLGAGPNRFRRASDFAIRLSSKAGAILRADYTGIRELPIDGNVGPAPAGPVERRGTSPG